MGEQEQGSRPWLFVGTIPDADFPLLLSPLCLNEDVLHLGAHSCPVHRGTPAMLAAAAKSFTLLRPKAAENDLLVLAAGDTGGGGGSRQVYARLVELLPALRPRGITFHYLLPDVDWHNRILLALDEPGPEETEQNEAVRGQTAPKAMTKRKETAQNEAVTEKTGGKQAARGAAFEKALLVADAGYMYAAKMSGYAQRYDLFTPDIGELAFLADESAPHPFYTRNFLLADEERAGELIARAYAGRNAARHMLVKGSVDRYVHDGVVLDTVSEPDVPMLEPVGGTGDTLTGIVSALLASGFTMRAACAAAFRINRRMGLLARPTPASPVAQLLAALPEAIRLCLGGQHQ